MSLLQEIQAAVIQPGSEIGPILLKLRLLAARLGSVSLEEWVKHESEGYPGEAQLPEYRVVNVSYQASFAGPFGSGINKIMIPPYLIEKLAGDSWHQRKIRQSMSSIDDMVRRANDSNDATIYIEAANLVLLLADKVYEDYNCFAATGLISKSAFVEMQQAVRSRVLELTIRLEQSIPEAATIAIGKSIATTGASVETVSQITNQVVYGGITNISSSGDNAIISVSVSQGDQPSVIDALIKAGFPKEDAQAFSELVASEKPESKAEPFGARAKVWIGDNLKKAAGGTWKMGISVATEVLKKAALGYYGL